MIISVCYRVENSVGKGENAGYSGLCGKQLNLYYTKMTFDVPRKKPFENTMGKGENAFSPFPTNSTSFNPVPDKPLISCICSTSLLKTLWEKEKLLVTRNFSFPHSVLSLGFKNYMPFASSLKLLSANFF